MVGGIDVEQQKESIESIVRRAPKGATHYMYPDEYFDEVFFKIDKDMIVESAWVVASLGSIAGFEEDCGYCRFDYEEGDMQPYVRWESLVELGSNTHSKWVPDTGEVVLFKRTDSIDYAYDALERMEVVTVVGDKVWLRNALRDLVTNLDNIYPLEKEKSLREELIDIMSCGGRWNFVNVDQAADRLIAAGIKLEGMQ